MDFFPEFFNTTAWDSQENCLLATNDPEYMRAAAMEQHSEAQLLKHNGVPSYKNFRSCKTYSEITRPQLTPDVLNEKITGQLQADLKAKREENEQLLKDNEALKKKLEEVTKINLGFQSESSHIHEKLTCLMGEHFAIKKERDVFSKEVEIERGQNLKLKLEKDSLEKELFQYKSLVKDLQNSDKSAAKTKRELEKSQKAVAKAKEETETINSRLVETEGFYRKLKKSYKNCLKRMLQIINKVHDPSKMSSNDKRTIQFYHHHVKRFNERTLFFGDEDGCESDTEIKTFDFASPSKETLSCESSEPSQKVSSSAQSQGVNHIQKYVTENVDENNLDKSALSSVNNSSHIGYTESVPTQSPYHPNNANKGISIEQIRNCDNQDNIKVDQTQQPNEISPCVQEPLVQSSVFEPAISSIPQGQYSVKYQNILKNTILQEVTHDQHVELKNQLMATSCVITRDQQLNKLNDNEVHKSLSYSNGNSNSSNFECDLEEMKLQLCLKHDLLLPISPLPPTPPPSNRIHPSSNTACDIFPKYEQYPYSDIDAHYDSPETPMDFTIATNTKGERQKSKELFSTSFCVPTFRNSNFQHQESEPFDLIEENLPESNAMRRSNDSENMINHSQKNLVVCKSRADNLAKPAPKSYPKIDYKQVGGAYELFVKVDSNNAVTRCSFEFQNDGCHIRVASPEPQPDHKRPNVCSFSPIQRDYRTPNVRNYSTRTDTSNSVDVTRENVPFVRPALIRQETCIQEEIAYGKVVNFHSAVENNCDNQNIHSVSGESLKRQKKNCCQTFFNEKIRNRFNKGLVANTGQPRNSFAEDVNDHISIIEQVPEHLTNKSQLHQNKIQISNGLKDEQSVSSNCNTVRKITNNAALENGNNKESFGPISHENFHGNPDVMHVPEQQVLKKVTAHKISQFNSPPNKIGSKISEFMPNESPRPTCSGTQFPPEGAFKRVPVAKTSQFRQISNDTKFTTNSKDNVSMSGKVQHPNLNDIRFPQDLSVKQVPIGDDSPCYKSVEMQCDIASINASKPSDRTSRQNLINLHNFSSSTEDATANQRDKAVLLSDHCYSHNLDDTVQKVQTPDSDFMQSSDIRKFAVSKNEPNPTLSKNVNRLNKISNGTELIVAGYKESFVPMSNRDDCYEIGEEKVPSNSQFYQNVDMPSSITSNYMSEPGERSMHVEKIIENNVLRSNQDEYHNVNQKETPKRISYNQIPVDCASELNQSVDTFNDAEGLIRNGKKSILLPVESKIKGKQIPPNKKARKVSFVTFPQIHNEEVFSSHIQKNTLEPPNKISNVIEELDVSEKNESFITNSHEIACYKVDKQNPEAGLKEINETQNNLEKSSAEEKESLFPHDYKSKSSGSGHVLFHGKNTFDFDAQEAVEIGFNTSNFNIVNEIPTNYSDETVNLNQAECLHTKRASLQPQRNFVQPISLISSPQKSVEKESNTVNGILMAHGSLNKRAQIQQKISENSAVVMTNGSPFKQRTCIDTLTEKGRSPTNCNSMFEVSPKKKTQIQRKKFENSVEVSTKVSSFGQSTCIDTLTSTENSPINGNSMPEFSPNKATQIRRTRSVVNAEVLTEQSPFKQSTFVDTLTAKESSPTNDYSMPEVSPKNKTQIQRKRTKKPVDVNTNASLFKQSMCFDTLTTPENSPINGNSMLAASPNYTTQIQRTRSVVNAEVLTEESPFKQSTCVDTLTSNESSSTNVYSMTEFSPNKKIQRKRSKNSVEVITKASPSKQSACIITLTAIEHSPINGNSMPEVSPNVKPQIQRKRPKNAVDVITKASPFKQSMCIDTLTTPENSPITGNLMLVASPNKSTQIQRTRSMMDIVVNDEVLTEESPFKKSTCVDSLTAKESSPTNDYSMAELSPNKKTQIQRGQSRNSAEIITKISPIKQSACINPLTTTENSFINRNSMPDGSPNKTTQIRKTISIDNAEVLGEESQFKQSTCLDALTAKESSPNDTSTPKISQNKKTQIQIIQSRNSAEVITINKISPIKQSTCIDTLTAIENALINGNSMPEVLRNKKTKNRRKRSKISAQVLTEESPFKQSACIDTLTSTENSLINGNSVSEFLMNRTTRIQRKRSKRAVKAVTEELPFKQSTYIHTFPAKESNSLECSPNKKTNIQRKNSSFSEEEKKDLNLHELSFKANIRTYSRALNKSSLKNNETGATTEIKQYSDEVSKTPEAKSQSSNQSLVKEQPKSQVINESSETEETKSQIFSEIPRTEKAKSHTINLPQFHGNQIFTKSSSELCKTDQNFDLSAIISPVKNEYQDCSNFMEYISDCINEFDSQNLKFISPLSSPIKFNTVSPAAIKLSPTIQAVRTSDTLTPFGVEALNVSNSSSIPPHTTVMKTNLEPCGKIQTKLFSDSETDEYPLVIAEDLDIEINDTNCTPIIADESQNEKQIIQPTERKRKLVDTSSKTNKCKKKSTKKSRDKRFQTSNLNVAQSEDTLKHPLNQGLAKLEELSVNAQHEKILIHNLVCILCNPTSIPSPEVAISIIVQYLSTSRRNPIMTFMIEKKMDDLMPTIEKCIISALLQTDKKKKPNLCGLRRKFLSALLDQVHADHILSIYGLSALCRVFTKVHMLNSDADKPRKLCYTLLETNSEMAPYVIASMCGVWPDILKVDDIEAESNPIDKAVFYLLLNKPKGLMDNHWKQCSFVLQTVCKIPEDAFKTAAGVALSIINEIREKSISGDDVPDEVADNYATALNILALREGWKWTKSTLIQTSIMPAILEFEAEDQFVATAVFFKFLGVLGVKSPRNDSDTIRFIMSTVKDMNEKAEKNISHPPIYVQEEAYISLYNLLRIKDERIHPFLFQWFLDYKDQLKPSTILRVKELSEKIPENKTSLESGCS